MSTRRRLAVSLVAAAAAAGAVPLFVGSPASSLPAPAQCPSTPSYDYTMVTPPGPPAAVDLSGSIGVDNISGLAQLGGDKKLYYQAHEYDVDPLFIDTLACLGGQATDAPAVINNSNGGVTFFLRVADGRVYYRSTVSPNPSAGGPGEYSSIGSFTAISNVNFTSGVAAVQTPDNVFHIFGRGTNGALYHAYLQGGIWRVENLGGSVTGQPVAVVDGTKVLIATATPDGSIYTKRGSTAAWGPFIKIMAGRTINGPALTTTTSPALAKNADNGDITLYAAATNQGLYRLSTHPGVAFPSTPWQRVDTVLPANARIAAVEQGDITPTLGNGNAIVYATWFDKASNKYVSAHTQFLGTDSSWHDYRLIPYSCFQCAPDGPISTTDKKATKLGTGFKQKADSKVALNSQK
jgi:Repeat of unknown function (DUF346)